ncbi:MAG: helix-turn-helix domain-containing protein [Ruminococcus sp.]|nr:helix-turn-helix domain-containing protein [Ruminococcus sp.]
MFLQTIHFPTNRHLTKSQVFLHDNPDPEKLETVSDKLKWYRINSGLLQRNIAKVMEVDRTTYSRYEDNVLERYPLDKLSKAAMLFEIDITSLLDDFNLFLYYGQGKQIKGLRKTLKLTQSQFAKYIKTPLGTLKKWEQNKANIPKTSFQKLLQLQKALNNV